MWLLLQHSIYVASHFVWYVNTSFVSTSILSQLSRTTGEGCNVLFHQPRRAQSCCFFSVTCKQRGAMSWVGSCDVTQVGDIYQWDERKVSFNKVFLKLSCLFPYWSCLPPSETSMKPGLFQYPQNPWLIAVRSFGPCAAARRVQLSYFGRELLPN